nr:MAG TPA: hypothetical protein [Caudoviricetes sp.]
MNKFQKMEIKAVKAYEKCTRNKLNRVRFRRVRRTVRHIYSMPIGDRYENLRKEIDFWNI